MIHWHNNESSTTTTTAKATTIKSQFWYTRTRSRRRCCRCRDSLSDCQKAHSDNTKEHQVHQYILLYIFVTIRQLLLLLIQYPPPTPSSHPPIHTFDAPIHSFFITSHSPFCPNQNRAQSSEQLFIFLIPQQWAHSYSLLTIYPFISCQTHVNCSV